MDKIVVTKAIIAIAAVGVFSAGITGANVARCMSPL